MIYQVKDPNGVIHEIEGPAGASPDEVIERAKSLVPKQESAKFEQQRDAIEPGVMGDTEPVEQKLLNNINAAGAGVTLPGTAVGLAKLAGLGDAAETAAKYAGQAGEKAMGRLHGTSPAMFKQQAAGHLENPQFSQAMRDSYAEGDANLLRGSLGRKAAINDRIQQYGQKIGDLRQEGSAAGPVRTADQMADALHDAGGKDFQPGGVNFQQEGEWQQQIDNIRKMQSTTPSDFADRATAINKAESKGMTQPKNVETQIANKMSQINNDDLATRLSPEKMAELKDASQKFGSAKSLVPAEIRSEGRDLRPTQMPNTGFGFAKQVAHGLVGGPKMEAQMSFGAESALKDAGSIIKNSAPPTIGGVTAQIMHKLTNEPQSLGKYAAPLMKAAQEGGSNGIAATHYILSTTHPEYNQMMQGEDAQ